MYSSLHTYTCNRCATGRYFQVLGNIHDIESYFSIDNAFSLNVQIFLTHWGHLAIIFWWVSANLFHMSWSSNYEVWLKNPILTHGIAHNLWDPHYSALLHSTYTSTGGNYAVVLSYSGINNWLYTCGFSSINQIYNFVIACEVIAVISILLAKLHHVLNGELLSFLAQRAQTSFMLDYITADAYGIRLNYHTGVLVGLTSLAWCGHLISLAIPVARGVTEVEVGAYLTFLGGLKSDTASLYLSDIAHHHLALGVFAVACGHIYASLNKSFGHRIRDVLYIQFGSTHHQTSSTSLHLALALALSCSSLITSWVAQQIYSLRPYFYLSYDLCASVCLWVHHSWIAGFLMVASFSHSAIYLIRDYVTRHNYGSPVERLLAHKNAILSGLTQICLWLGFHTLAVYSHNDTVVAFGEPEKQISRTNECLYHTTVFW
jgi:photosystem I P700 chlorophyll a apoprotein A2